MIIMLVHGAKAAKDKRPHRALVLISSLCLSILISACSTEPSAEERLSIFHSTKQEQLQETIWFTGDTTVTNEDRLDLFFPHVRNLGGGYIGVGSGQNFSLAGRARSDWIWLMDFTEVVVAANKINIAFVRHAEQPEEFRRLWDRPAEEDALRIIDQEYADDPDLEFIKKAWSVSLPFQQKRFRTDDVVMQKYNYELWLKNKDDYNHIRKLALENRIQAVKGDLRGPITVLSIADAARKMQVPVRVIYFSNAEEYFDLDGQFRTNWLNMPVDDASMLVRTISVQQHRFPWAPGSEHSTERGFHYNVMPARLYQAWLRDSAPGLRSRDILAHGEIDTENGFSIVRSGPPQSEIPAANSPEAP
ncbi:MAG: hypothetical protein KDK30_05895 [Leptospiraceae bacterium]|nr:hypothetical protein [Leptospiraceae bacterium]MCB1315883.1 hypothetical protein [Leptospiraceae bacterium]MCB1319949.1 hypothetical protein [Leptospiraceae bacterium]